MATLNFIFRNGNKNHMAHSIEDAINMATLIADSRNTFVLNVCVAINGSTQSQPFDFNKYAIKNLTKQNDTMFIRFEDGGRMRVDVIKVTPVGE